MRAIPMRMCSGRMSAVAIAALMLTLAVLVRSGPTVTAQTPGPTPTLPPLEDIDCRYVSPTLPAPSGGRPSVAAFTTDTATYRVGAPVTITFTLANPTDAPAIITGNAPRLEWWVQASGGDVAFSEPPFRSRAPQGYCVIPPGATYATTVVWDQRTREGAQVAPGTYRVWGALAGGDAGDTSPATFTIEARTATSTPQTVNIPGSVTLERGGSVTFRRPSDGATLTVTHAAESRASRATVSHDGTGLTIDASAGASASDMVFVPAVVPPPCSGLPHVVRCDVRPGADAPSLTFVVTPPPTVTIPGSATLEPGESVLFRRPSDGATLTVTSGFLPYRSLTVEYDGDILIATTPFPVPWSPPRGSGPGARCAALDGRLDATLCAVQPTVEGARLSIGYPVHREPPGPSALALTVGCTNLTLTWTVGTSLAMVAGSVYPPSALEAVWRYDEATRRFRAWSPAAPQDANDYRAVGARLEPVFVCLKGRGALFRPSP